MNLFGSSNNVHIVRKIINRMILRYNTNCSSFKVGFRDKSQTRNVERLIYRCNIGRHSFFLSKNHFLFTHFPQFR